MNPTRWLLVGAAFVLSCVSGAAQAQVPVRVLVGFVPGGELDAVARLFAEKLAEGIGRPVLVENRAGAGGQIAIRTLKASAPDGNSLMVIPDSTITLYPHTVKAPEYDTLKDFVPIAHLGSFYNGLAVGAGVPAKDFAEWLSWVKSDPKNATYGSPGAGTVPHFLGLILSQATGVQLVNVPFKGVPPAIADLMAGQLPSAMLTFGALARQAKSGRIRILAFTGSQRSPIAPDVPSFKELGYPALEVSGWYGMFAPAGIRSDVVARYHDIIVQAQRTPVVRERLRALDLEQREPGAAELAAMVRSEYGRWGPVVKASGFSEANQ
jgi:tripartite-type tricarboxylate transporter receptor subunit TctC